jgi:glycerol kinase
MARAALEAMAYSTADVVDTMVSVSGTAFERLRVDGGATQNDWLMHFQADVLGVDVERPRNVETTAFGAAGLAGIAGGVWRDAAEFYAQQDVATFHPTRSRREIAEWRKGWARAMRAAIGWARDGA